MLTFETFHQAVVQRTLSKFHAISDWSPADWAVAAAGELGEACNLIKKLRRLTGPTKESGRMNTPAIETLIPLIGKEIGDTVVYLDLLCARLNLKLENVVRKAFNEVSARVGSNIMLPERGKK